jgi:alpha-tubulin suppressor-like RCC1 family protein
MKDNTIKSIVCGRYHTIIYKNDGTVLVFGYNGCGQLGLSDRKSRLKPVLLMKDKAIRSIVCGYFHTIIYKNDGTVLVFGLNKDGELGLNDNKNRDVPTILFRDTNIISINDTNCKLNFNIYNCKLYPKGLKDIMWTFLLVNKIKRFKLPKWLRVHVIKFIYENY